MNLVWTWGKTTILTKKKIALLKFGYMYFATCSMVIVNPVKTTCYFDHDDVFVHYFCMLLDVN